MELAKRIKNARKQRGFTQEALAEAANISRSYLAGVEGSRYNPSLNTLISIGKALHIELSELVDEEPPTYEGPQSSIEEDFKDELFDDEDVRMIARDYKSLSPKSKEFLKKMLNELD